MAYFLYIMLRDLKEIKKIRTNLSMTQSELAERAGVSQSLIAKIENGNTIPSYDKGRAILDALEDIIRQKGSSLTASDVHNTVVISIGPDESLGNALQLMKENAVSQLPVIQHEVVVGGLTERCLLNNFDELDRAEKVRTLMEDPFPVVSVKSNIGLVRELLSYYPAVISISEGIIAGIITKADLLEEILVS